MSTEKPSSRTFAERLGLCPVLASPLTGPDTHTKGLARGLRRGEGAHGFGGSIRSIFFRRNNPAIIRNGRASASLRACRRIAAPLEAAAPIARQRFGGAPACRWTASILSGFQRDTQFTSAAWWPATSELHVSWFSWRQGGPRAFQILGPSALRGSSGPHRVSSPLGGGCRSPRRNRNPCSR